MTDETEETTMTDTVDEAPKRGRPPKPAMRQYKVTPGNFVTGMDLIAKSGGETIELPEELAQALLEAGLIR